jgi:hypothetical protein
VKRKDLEAWESEYGGTTAEGIAKRVINKYNPSSEELSRVVNRGRGKKTEDAAQKSEDMCMDAVAETGSDGMLQSLIAGIQSAAAVLIPCLQDKDCAPAKDISSFANLTARRRGSSTRRNCSWPFATIVVE